MVRPPMNKGTVFALLASRPCNEAEAVRAVAQALRITRQAVYAWPEQGHLPRIVADRVLAAAVRRRAQAMADAGQPMDPLELDAITLPE
jgi:hypothetical protein